MKRYVLLGATTLLAAACDTPTAPRMPAASAAASAAVVRNDRFERHTFAISRCNGDRVEVDVTFHVLTAVTFDQAGGSHVKLHRNVSGQGTNPVTGDEYVVSQVRNEHFDLGPGATEHTTIFRFTLMGKGQVPNESVHSNFHFTITPDGDVSSNHNNFMIKCSA